MYREPPRDRDAVEARLLWRTAFVVPLVVVALLSALLSARAVANAHVTLVVHAFAAGRYEPAREGMIIVPARDLVGEWELRSGFGDRQTGELEAWYAQVRVRDAHVMLEAPKRWTLPYEPNAVAIERPQPAPATSDFGFESESPRDRGDIARAFEAWEDGPRVRPFVASWWISPAPETYAFIGVFVTSVLVLAALRRGRVRAILEDGVVRLEVRRVFGAHTASFPRSEIRTITVEVRVVGPFSFARPVVVTTQGRKIPVGPCALPDAAASELARTLPR